MHTLRASSLVIVAALGLLAGSGGRLAHAGQCAPRALGPKIVTADNATIPTGGGILVVETIEDLPVSAASGPVSSWRFVDGTRRVAPTARTLAPGLTVLQPVGTTLENGKRGRIRTFRRAAAGGPVLAAPALKAVEQLQSYQGRRVSTWVRVTLAKPVAADRYLVVFDKDGKVARSFGAAKAGATSVGVYWAGECTTLPDGTQPTTSGDSIKLAWVDATGRMSALSAAVTVGSPADGPIAPGAP